FVIPITKVTAHPDGKDGLNILECKIIRRPDPGARVVLAAPAAKGPEIPLGGHSREIIRPTHFRDLVRAKKGGIAPPGRPRHRIVALISKVVANQATPRNRH